MLYKWKKIRLDGLWPGVLILLGGLFFAGQFRTAEAAANPLELIINEPLFDVTNAAPGQSISSPVELLNHGDRHETFQFEIDLKTNSKSLANRLFFKVTDDADKCLYGCDGNINLSYLNRREPDIARVGPHSTTYYNFILTLDPDAGNALQDALTTFDMKLGFEGTVTGHRRNGPGNNNAVAAGANAVNTGLATGVLPAGTVAGEEAPAAGENTPAGEVKGEEAAPGEVQGAESCRSWPKWVWVLMLVAYFALLGWRTFENIKKQIEKREIRWKWQAVLAVAAFLVWYFGDVCREFLWFVIAVIVGGAGVYLFYLYLFKKGILEDIK